MTVTPGEVLGGIDPVVDAVASRLEQRVPDELDRLETAYGRPVPRPTGGESDMWRPPGVYGRSDRSILEPDDYPAVLVVPQGSGEAVVIDIVDGAPVWRIPYVVRCWGFCRYYGAEEVAACRNRLALGVLQAVIRAPKLTETLAVDLSGWRQSFSDVGVDDVDSSTVAGWWLEVTVNAVETVTLDSVAVAATVGLAVHPEADD